MTGWLTEELQATRPELDEVFDGLGMTLRVQRPAPPPDDLPPDIDKFGSLALPLVTPTTGYEAIFPAYGYQLSTRERQEKGIGADIPVPVWEVIVRWTAPLDVPGFTLTLEGGELDTPLPLTVIGDAEDMGSVRLAWRLLCRATEARSGP